VNFADRFEGVSMRKLCSFLLVLTCSLWLIPAGVAQTGKGSITGSVTDTSGGALVGAQVSIESRGVSTVSDAKGQFFINDLEPGSYAIAVTYVGFKTFTQTVNVTAGHAATVEAKLGVESQNLEVLVTAERASGEAEEVNRERSADSIVQVLTSDVIRSLPNANMADALGRLPSVTIERDEGEGKYVQVRGTEPRLTNTTIDGINVPSPESGVRQIKFDAIPADIVESVEINKTLQANMDGDGIGGSVNLVTKTAGERPTVNVSGMGGYTPIQSGRGLVETTGTLGQRFGAGKKFGLLLGGSYDWNGRGIDDIEPVPDIATFGSATGPQARYFDSIDIREYQYYRSRWGLAGSADYKIADGSSIYIRGLYSDFHNYGSRWVYTLNDNTPGVSLATVNAGVNGTGCPVNSNGFTFTDAADPCTGIPSFNAQLRHPDYAIGSVLLGGKHVLATTWYTWDVSASRSSQTGEVGDKNASFKANNLSSSTCQFDPAATKNLYLPQWAQACFTEAYSQANFNLTDLSLTKGLSAQLNLQLTGAMAKRFHLGSHLSTIEIGGKFRNAHKFDNEFFPDYSPNTQTAAPMSNFPSKFSNSSYYNGGAYKLGPNPAFQDIFAFVNSNTPSLFTLTPGTGGNSANYDLIEKVSAGYIMDTLDLSSRWRLYAGVRFEGTNLDTLTFLTDQATGNSSFVPASGSYLKILPSASLRYALTTNTNLRVAYSRGLSRPNPQDIAQAGTFTPGTNPIPVSIGNPNLKAESADNVDVLLEHYINPFGLFTAGYFYKNLTEPIVSQQFTVLTGTFFGANCASQPNGCQVTQPINAGSAWLNGFEAAYLQHLTFLPGVFQGLGISANYSYTASRASGLPNRSDHPRLIRNAPHSWNISPTYDRGRVSVRVGLSYNAANINAYQFKDANASLGGIHGPLGDDYFFAHLQFDAQGSVRMTHGLSFVMYGLNLTNEVFGFYFGSQQYFHQREFYQPTIAAGFRWSPTHEK
jgi:TonB-dependent receptor